MPTKFKFLSKTLFVPVDKEEQKHIATFLERVNRKIELTEVQISKMEQFKKGLLQSL